jgi:hypothetical protein
MQPYDQKGEPIFRNPEGKLVDTSGTILPAKTPRFAANGQQLDPFNRPLPPGAVPMFTVDGSAIGVGPDGRHYLPDGTEVPQDAPHFDAEGEQLAHDVVQAANNIASDVSVAIKVRARLKGDGSAPEAVDALGRTFRESTDVKSGTLINADGDKVPLKSARRIESDTGKLVDYEVESKAAEALQVFTLLIKVDNEGDENEIGSVEINNTTTLKDVRNMIHSDVHTDLTDFVFLVNHVAMLKYEEGDKLAVSCMPEVIIRGKELKTIEAPKSKFNKRVETFLVQEEQKKREKSEFEDIMARVRQGQFLKSVKPTLMDP